MTLFRLQHHRTRIPAIPPKLGPLSYSFSFHKFDFDVPYDWPSSNPHLAGFLAILGLKQSRRIIDIFGSHREANDLHHALRAKGIEIRMTESPSGEVTLTAIFKHARISPKLLATFPWKLRRLQK